MRKFSRACCSERGTPTPQTPCPWSTKSRAIVTQHGMGSADLWGVDTGGQQGGDREGLAFLSGDSWDPSAPHPGTHRSPPVRKGGEQALGQECRGVVVVPRWHKRRPLFSAVPVPEMKITVCKVSC